MTRDYTTLATTPDYFASVLTGYRESVILDEVRSNRFIEEKLKEISARCRDLQSADLPHLSSRQRSEVAAP